MTYIMAFKIQDQETHVGLTWDSRQCQDLPQHGLTPWLISWFSRFKIKSTQESHVGLTPVNWISQLERIKRNSTLTPRLTWGLTWDLTPVPRSSTTPLKIGEILLSREVSQETSRQFKIFQEMVSRTNPLERNQRVKEKFYSHVRPHASSRSSRSSKKWFPDQVHLREIRESRVITPRLAWDQVSSQDSTSWLQGFQNNDLIGHDQGDSEHLQDERPSM